MRVFTDRRDAGQQLAEALRELAIPSDRRVVVLAIPRGGLPVGAEVARALRAELDVVVIRKLRVPQNPGLGFGAVGTDGHVVIDDETVARLGLTEEQVAEEVSDRRAMVAQRLELYRRVAPAVELDGAVVIVVDDGIATGETARQACALARRHRAATVILAVAVAPSHLVDDLAHVADQVVVLSQPEEFLAVGQAYQQFDQLSDADALEALQVAGRETPRDPPAVTPAG